MNSMRDDRPKPPSPRNEGRIAPGEGEEFSSAYPPEELTPDALARHIAPEPPRHPSERPRAATSSTRQTGRIPRVKRSLILDLWHRKPILLASLGAGVMVLISLLVFGLVSLLTPASAPPSEELTEAQLSEEGPGGTGDAMSGPEDVSPSAAQDEADVTPVLTTSSLIEVQPAASIPFPIAIDGTDGLPQGSMVSISGLPEGMQLSAGQASGSGTWNLQINEISNLLVTVPVETTGAHDLRVAVSTPQGAVLTEATSRLVVRGEIGQSEETAAPPSSNATGADANGEAATSPSGDTAEADPEEATEPVEQPEPSASLESQVGEASEGEGKWMVVTTAVNMRAEPSSTGQTVTVMQAGKRLKVTDDEYGWLKVTDPDGGQGGWIYKTFLKDPE